MIARLTYTGSMDVTTWLARTLPIYTHFINVSLFTNINMYFVSLLAIFVFTISNTER